MIIPECEISSKEMRKMKRVDVSKRLQEVGETHRKLC